MGFESKRFMCPAAAISRTSVSVGRDPKGTNSMRAALLEKNQKPLVVVNDVDLEGPGPGEVVVKISHCGICHSDLTMVDLPAGGPLPSIYGHEAAGVVEEVGSSVTRLARGDKVMLKIGRAHV